MSSRKRRRRNLASNDAKNHIDPLKEISEALITLQYHFDNFVQNFTHDIDDCYYYEDISDMQFCIDECLSLTKYNANYIKNYTNSKIQLTKVILEECDFYSSIESVTVNE